MKIWFAQHNTDNDKLIHTDLILNITKEGTVTIEFLRESCLFLEKIEP